MKKITKFVALAVSALALYMTGCSDVTDGTVGTQNEKSNSKNITFTVDSDDELVNFGSDSRSIVPGTMDSTTLVYYLKYLDKQTAGTAQVKKVAFTKGSTNSEGKVELKLADSYYDFTLYAYKTDPSISDGDAPSTIADTAVLVGYASADLRNNDTVHFYLTADGLSGTGDVKLYLYTDEWDLSDAAYTNYEVTCGLYDIKTGTVLGSTEETLTKTNIKKVTTKYVPGGSPTPAAPAVGAGNTYSKATVTPGTYNLEVKFKNSITNKQYVYSDRIVVLPGQTTEDYLYIPAVIELPPAAPSTFTAAYQIPDWTTDYYNVEFRWDCAAKNESYFRIELLEVNPEAKTSALNADTTTEWEDPTYSTTLNSPFTTYRKCYASRDGASIDVAGNAVTEIAFYGNDDVWVASPTTSHPSTLQKNSNHAIFKLPMGKRYLARICSVNDAGCSAYKYYVYNDSITTSGYESPETGYKLFTADNKTINLFRVRYNLNGGLYKAVAAAGCGLNTKTRPGTVVAVGNTVSGKDTATIASDFIDAYYSVGTTCHIFNPLNDTEALLTKNGNNFTKWKVGKITGRNYTMVAPAAPATYYTFKNYDYEDDGAVIPVVLSRGFESIELVASYQVDTAAVDIKDDNLLDIKDTCVALAGESGSTFVDTAKPKYVLTKTAKNTINFTVTPLTTASYDHVTMSIKRSGTTYNIYNNDMTKGASAYTAAEDFTKYPIGKYFITFSGYTSKNAVSPYTYSVVLEIVE